MKPTKSLFSQSLGYDTSSGHVDVDECNIAYNIAISRLARLRLPPPFLLLTSRPSPQQAASFLSSLLPPSFLAMSFISPVGAQLAGYAFESLLYGEFDYLLATDRPLMPQRIGCFIMYYLQCIQCLLRGPQPKSQVLVNRFMSTAASLLFLFISAVSVRRSRSSENYPLTTRV